MKGAAVSATAADARTAAIGRARTAARLPSRDRGGFQAVPNSYKIVVKGSTDDYESETSSADGDVPEPSSARERPSG